jgi:hypothetical protein
MEDLGRLLSEQRLLRPRRAGGAQPSERPYWRS